MAAPASLPQRRTFDYDEASMPSQQAAFPPWMRLALTWLPLVFVVLGAVSAYSVTFFPLSR